MTSLLGSEELNCEEHAVCVRSASKEARKERVEAETAFVDKLKATAPRDAVKRYMRVGASGAWLTVCPDTLGGTLLSQQEFVDNARIQLNLKVLNLPQHCDGCGAEISVEHALSCKKGGLVSIRHDDVRNEAGALAELALPKTRVSYEPFIFHGAGTRVGGAATLAECSSLVAPVLDMSWICPESVPVSLFFGQNPYLSGHRFRPNNR